MSYYRGKEKIDIEDEDVFRRESPTKEPIYLSSKPDKSFINWRYILVIALSWLALIHYFERIHVGSAINKCKWDKWEEWDIEDGGEPHRIALIADPQIVDNYSYQGIQGKLTRFIEMIADNYAHRNYEYLQDILDPHTTIFLGDLFDGGREWEDKEWFEEYKRFNRMFKPRLNRRFINSIPGNHDIGFESIEYDKVKRFTAFFGDMNSIVELGNHSIISLDSISLSHPDPKINYESKKFLDTLNDRLHPEFPRILLMHVPLYRFSDQQTCGPLRESRSKFPIQRGTQYQTVIEYDISQEILTKIHPEIAFAGDDHDFCDIRQSYSFNGGFKTTREITVKSFAMNGGVHRPAMQLLSLYNPYNPKLPPKDTLQTEMCFMPLPYRPLKFYSFTLILSIAFLTVKYLFPVIFKKYLKRTLIILQADTELPRWKLNTVEEEKRWFAYLFHLSFAFMVPIAILKLYFSNI